MTLTQICAKAISCVAYAPGDIVFPGAEAQYLPFITVGGFIYSLDSSFVEMDQEAQPGLPRPPTLQTPHQRRPHTEIPPISQGRPPTQQGGASTDESSESIAAESVPTVANTRVSWASEDGYSKCQKATATGSGSAEARIPPNVAGAGPDLNATILGW